MHTGPPHLYRAQGRALGVTDDALEAALVASTSVEAHGVVPILTLNHLAVQTGETYGFLRGIVKRHIDPYTEFTRHRRGGGRLRTISAPTPRLMNVQRWILASTVGRILPNQVSYAYTRGRSVAMCAS